MVERARICSCLITTTISIFRQTVDSVSPPPPAIMNQLPREIWLQVADYVAPLELEKLFSLNSAFYHVTMEQKYGQVSFAFLSVQMERLLARLRYVLG